MTKKIGFCILLLGNMLFMYAHDTEELRRIKSNYRNLMIPTGEQSDSLWSDFIRIEPESEISDQVVAELHQRYPFDLVKLNRYIETLKPDGAWPDINYADTKRSGWEPKQHAERILELAKLYYSPTTKLQYSKRIKEVIHRALGYWFTTKPTCLNWWYNQIGVPKTLGAAFVLLEEQLSDSEKEAAIEVMNHSKFGMTGQNKVWLAGNVLIRALLQDDAALVKSARDTSASEIVLRRKEGIKPDWSFHQHGAQQQFGNYGLSYVSGMSFFNRLFKGTSYQFDERQLSILRSLIDEGYRWVIWNRYMDISSLGRQLFHHAQLHKGYGLAFAASDFGWGGFPRQGNPLVGHKHFDNSDYTIHRAKNWMASIKMSSARVIGTELVNEDNLKGYYMGDGATYFYVRGDEYLNIFPLWDWRKIPGVTAYEDVRPMPSMRERRSNNQSTFVGGLSNGRNGLSAMQLQRDGLTAYKAWFCTDDFILCLGAGIQSDSILNVTTSIDQRLKVDQLQVRMNDDWRKVSGHEALETEELRLYHDRTGYIVFSDDVLQVEVGEREGRWHDFMKMYRPAIVKGEVVTLHLRHGIQPQNATYCYVVLPDVERESVEYFIPSQAFRIVRNDTVAQILQVPSAGNGYWAAVYQPLRIELDGRKYAFEAPGIYYVEGDKRLFHNFRH